MFLIKIVVLAILSNVTRKCLCLSGWLSKRWDNMHHQYSRFTFSFANQEEHCKRKWWVNYRQVVKNLWTEGLHKHWLHMIRDCCNLWLCGELVTIRWESCKPIMESELQKFSLWIAEWYIILTQWLLIILDVTQKLKGKNVAGAPRHCSVHRDSSNRNFVFTFLHSVWRRNTKFCIYVWKQFQF